MSVRSSVKKLIPKSLFMRIEPLGHLLEVVIFNLLRGFPASRKLKVIGVTGTDGKTTTCTLIAQMLKTSGKKVGVLTTLSVDYGDGKGEQPSPTSQTTASVGLLLDMLGRMRRNKVDWVVMEVSSHALAQYRVWGIPYSIAVITNVTPEHLDYHGTFQRYLAAKTKLFKHTDKNRKGLRTGVVNADDPNADLFASSITHPVLYGIDKGDIKASQIQLTAAGSHYMARIDEDEYEIDCQLPGRFNVYNSLAAVAVGRIIGLKKDEIERGIASLKGLPGRMERIKGSQPFEVIIDYAVTPEALKSVLSTLKSVTPGSVHLVFGATGDRDKAKRPVMGQVAAELADHIYLTDDETYTEDPATIRQAVYEGIDKAGGAAKTAIIADRMAAIQSAFAYAQPGDSVVLTGIGHQKYRNMAGRKESWDERDIARRLLQKLTAGNTKHP